MSRLHPLRIVEYAAANGFSFEAACAAIDLYEEDPDYYNERGLPVLLRHASPDAAVDPQPRVVRV